MIIEKFGSVLEQQIRSLISYCAVGDSDAGNSSGVISCHSRDFLKSI
jgi:hypothetical protein